MCMERIYLLEGENQLQAEETIAALIKDSGVDEAFSCVKYSGDEVALEVVIEDCQTEPFFDERKVVVLNHPVFLTADKGSLEQDLEGFLHYIQNPNERTTLIINAVGYRLDNRNTILKELRKVAKVLTFDAFDESVARIFVQSLIEKKGKKIERDALEELISRTACDAQRLKQELEKLDFYLDEEETITRELVQMIVSEPLETNIFKLTNAIIEGKSLEAIKTYHQLKQLNEEPIVFSAILAKNFHYMHVIKTYQKIGYSEYQLRPLLKLHPYQLKKLYQIARQTDERLIQDQIEHLAEYDRHVKQGKIDKYLGFELFLLSHKY